MRNWISSITKDLLVVGSIKDHTVEALDLNSKGGEIPLINLGTHLGAVNVGALTIQLTTAQTEILINKIQSNKNMKKAPTTINPITICL